jgi:hypothetical protein
MERTLPELLLKARNNVLGGDEVANNVQILLPFVQCQTVTVIKILHLEFVAVDNGAKVINGSLEKFFTASNGFMML